MTPFTDPGWCTDPLRSQANGAVSTRAAPEPVTTSADPTRDRGTTPVGPGGAILRPAEPPVERQSSERHVAGVPAAVRQLVAARRGQFWGLSLLSREPVEGVGGRGVRTGPSGADVSRVLPGQRLKVDRSGGPCSGTEVSWALIREGSLQRQSRSRRHTRAGGLGVAN